MKNLFDLNGKTALVTGGSKGLGKAMALGLAHFGADLMICSRNADELDSTAAEISEATGKRVETVVADLANRDDIGKLVEACESQFEAIDILINNAGSNIPQPVVEITDEAWDQILQLNLSSCMALTRAFAPKMVERGWGRVIYISSIMGQAGAPQRSIYSATKSALMGMARPQALELGTAGVTVNCIAPGPFLTDLPATVLSEEIRNHIGNRTALKRWGDIEELVGPMLMLASDAGSYVTGTTITIDGGIMANVV